MLWLLFRVVAERGPRRLDASLPRVEVEVAREHGARETQTTIVLSFAPCDTLI